MQNPLLMRCLSFGLLALNTDCFFSQETKVNELQSDILNEGSSRGWYLDSSLFDYSVTWKLTDLSFYSALTFSVWQDETLD